MNYYQRNALNSDLPFSFPMPVCSTKIDIPVLT